MIGVSKAEVIPEVSRVVGAARGGVAPSCFHCGLDCPQPPLVAQGRNFCCAGCQTVHELLTENGLSQFYALAPGAGVRRSQETARDRFQFLDEPQVRERLVDYSDGTTTHITFRVPAVHCVACVWLLENLFRLRPGIGTSRVNFAQREVSVQFRDREVRLSEVAELIASLGYPPELKLADLSGQAPDSTAPRRLWLQIAVAGFAFGNSMLLSLPAYFGLDPFIGPDFRQLVGWLSLALSIPVVSFSAGDYWRRAWLGFRLRRMNIEVPIAVGVAALFLQSAFDVMSGRGEGYFDSLAGLIFFLLCGRWFQEKTYDRLVFDRDYTSFFPLSVRRLTASGTETVSLGRLEIGDRIQLRNGELVPADARLVGGGAVIDYSFVTGESAAVEKRPGEIIYAGGRQTAGLVLLELVKPVSQSYLTSLWNQDIFQKDKLDGFDDLTNRYSERFTWIILAIAVGAAGFWVWADPSRAMRAWVGVLIVACPCALALAAPFTLGAALRALGRRQVFLRKTQVLEHLARIDSVVFDKTGTLTLPGGGEVSFEGPALSVEETRWVGALAGQSIHPLSVRLAGFLPLDGKSVDVQQFEEIPGAGIVGTVLGRELRLGSADWLRQGGISDVRGATVGGTPRVETASNAPSEVHLAVGGRYRGRFAVVNPLRQGVADTVRHLSRTHRVSLLSGDNARERERLQALFGPEVELHFHQSPQDKLDYIRRLQAAGHSVMMVGDGLNDAGALQQSDVGIAVVEDVGVFSPASDVILHAPELVRLPAMLGFARQSVRIVRWSFALSAAYNVVGLVIAASGRLEPVVCAILMPLSSVSVVAFAVGLIQWASRVLEQPAVADVAGTKLVCRMTTEGVR